MAYVALGKMLPKAISRPLFGDRDLFGRVPIADDPSWIIWRKLDNAFYDENQRQSVGALVNHAGYQVMRRVRLESLNVLEIGPGALDHIDYWCDKPSRFFLADIRAEFFDRAEMRLQKAGVPVQRLLVEPERPGLPLADNSIDTIISFYSLEHLHPLIDYVNEMLRVLKPGGMLVGAIPCEGGMAWGVGRFLTTRRWLKAHGCNEPDKIISWEHPNFSDNILNVLSKTMKRELVNFWPLPLPCIDINLVARLVYRKC